MKKYTKEIIIFLLQTIVFYIFPLFVREDLIGMILSMVILTFILSLIIGITSKTKIKYLYPIYTSISFIPTIFIYYNESALIHSVWYFSIATIGLLLGIVCKLLNK